MEQNIMQRIDSAVERLKPELTELTLKIHDNPELGKDQVRLAYVLCKDDLRRAIMILEKALEAYNGMNK